MRKRLRLRETLLVTATMLPLVAGISLGITRSLQHEVSLEEVCELSRSRRFDEARARGEAYLGLYPDDSQALLVMSEVALSRPGPDPREALAYLRRVRPDSPSMAAWVLVDQGNAYDLLAQFERSEACWSEALKRDPTTLEAGRRLLDLLGLQGRLLDARLLALKLFDREHSPRERLKLLLRLAQLEVDPPDPWLIINKFEPAVHNRAADLSTTVACGLALVSVSRSHDGLPMLRESVGRNPDSVSAWDALLTGLELSADRQELVDTFARLPRHLVDDPRFARHRGWIEQEAGRWSEAADSYRSAWDLERDITVGYRLRRTLLLAGLNEEAKRFDTVFMDYREAFKRVRGIVDDVNSALRQDKPEDPGIYQLMSELRSRMGRGDEAAAWRRLSVVAR